MEEMVGPLSTSGRELLRGWWRPIGLMVTFIDFYGVSSEYFECWITKTRIQTHNQNT
jgi:hypothetical protein